MAADCWDATGGGHEGGGVSVEKVVPLVSGGMHGRTGTGAPVQQDLCMDARVPVHTRSPGPSYKESYIISNNISSYDTNTGTRDGENVVRESEVQTSALRRKLVNRSERFLRGPIPLSHIIAAGALPGRALLVLLAIRHRIDLAGKPRVSLPAAVMRDFSFDRFAKSRALVELERIGLIQVHRVKGHPALVSLVSKRTGGRENAGRSVP